MVESGDAPRRRHDDFVTYRDMVEYVSDQEAKWHSVRAESIIAINNQMEKLDDTLSKTVQNIQANFQQHETWHRDVLQGILDRSVQSKLSSGALIVSIVSVIISTTIAVIALVVR